MNTLKRKTPSWATPGSTPSTPTTSGYISNALAGPSTAGGRPGIGTPGVRVKNEPGADEGWKRSKLGMISNSHTLATDPRTAALDLEEELKSRGTMPMIDAHFFLQEQCPEVDSGMVIEILKGLPRVGFNTANEVLSYVPALTISSQTQLLTHIRLHTTPLQSLNLRDTSFKDATKDQPVSEWLLDLERSGEVMLCRGTGPFQNSELPRLGRKNGLGMGIMDQEKNGMGRIRGVFWDEVRGKGRAGKRVEDEFIHLWADVPIAETDDVAKLLAQQDLSNSSVVPEAPKVILGPTAKKKKKSNRVLKITNTHMKALGIDFSKDYDAGNK